MRLHDGEQALMSEKVLLESVLLNNDYYFTASSLQPQDFQTDYHRQMWTAISDKISAGEKVDAIILFEHFSRQRSSGGVAKYVAVFDADVLSSSSQVERHVEEIAQSSQRRRILHVLEAALAQANDLSEDNASVISVTYDRLHELQEKSSAAQTFAISDIAAEYCDRIEKIANRERSLGAYTLSIPRLDEMTTGMRPKEYVIVGAYPGEGKTAFVLQVIAANCHAGAKVGLFSQEMSKEAIYQRLLIQAAEGGVHPKKLRNPKLLNGTDIAILRESRTKIDGWKLWVNDTSSFRATELVAHAHMMVKRYGVRMFVIDYLQLLRADGEKRYEQVSNASAALREFAKNQDVAVIAVSQLSRPEGKVKKRPTMFDLRESGQLEQDSHLVLFPFRPVDKSGHMSGDDEIVIGKQREGPVGIVPVVFDKNRLAFLPRESSHAEDDSTWPE